MSGGCCSPLGPGTGPVVAFYQTVIDNDAGVFPQQLNLEFQTPDFTVTDDPGANATRIRAPGIAAAQATADTALANAATAQTTANAAGTVATTALANAATAQATATAAQQPFKGTYYADPAFAGTSTGSASNPYGGATPITSALAAMVSLALVGGVIRIPPAVTITENVTFPDTGGNYEIQSDTGFDTGAIGPRVSGTLVATSTSATVTSFRLSNLIWNGNISGNTSAGVAESVMRSVRHVGTLTLTTSGTGVWVAVFKGDGAVSSNKTGGSTSGLVSVAGTINADGWVFAAGFTDGTASSFNPPQGSQFHDCQFGDLTGTAVPIGISGTASNSTRFLSCYFDGPVTFTIANANHTILMDPASYASLMAVGVTFAGAGAATAKIQVLSGASDLRTLTGNLGSTALGARAAPGLYEVLFDQTTLVVGTAGTAQVNIIYTDMTGTLVTVPVGLGLLVTAVAGTKAAAVLPFQHNGAVAPIAYSVTGVVTSGTLSIASAVSIRKVS